MNSINHNLMAANVANNLNTHYGRLSTSVERLSSGLRINSAADDAAGLAIRELMRADVAALNQGVRNANDAISMLQVADSALGVIDEKLIRMKELAEQAATGTYTSDQRLMIDSEFQAMGAEIDRIARATDFNGIHLLDGSLSGQHNGAGLNAAGQMKIHFGTANDAAEDYYYVDIGDCSTRGLGLRDIALAPGAPTWVEEAVIDLETRHVILDIPFRAAGTYDHSPAAIPNLQGMDYYQLPTGLKNVTITSNLADPGLDVMHKPHVSIFTKSGTQLTGVPIQADSSLPWTTWWHPDIESTGATNAQLINGKSNSTVFYTAEWWCGQGGDQVIQAGIVAGIFDQNAVCSANNVIYDAGQSITVDGSTITLVTSQNEIGGLSMHQYGGDPPETRKLDEIITIDEVGSNLVFMIGGHAPPDITTNCNLYSLKIEADMTDEFVEKIYGSTNRDEMSDGLLTIETQEKAQKALVRVDEAIVRKDKVRAHLGSLQNRLENTVTNLIVQGENLQNAESRISDTDVAQEMMNFVRNQVLTQSAVAMLGQANSYPHILSQLING